MPIREHCLWNCVFLSGLVKIKGPPAAAPLEYMPWDNLLPVQTLTDEMKFSVNVLTPIVKDWVLAQCDGSLVVHLEFMSVTSRASQSALHAAVMLRCTQLHMKIEPPPSASRLPGYRVDIEEEDDVAGANHLPPSVGPLAASRTPSRAHGRRPSLTHSGTCGVGRKKMNIANADERRGELSLACILALVLFS